MEQQTKEKNLLNAYKVIEEWERIVKANNLHKTSPDFFKKAKIMRARKLLIEKALDKAHSNAPNFSEEILIPIPAIAYGLGQLVVWGWRGYKAYRTVRTIQRVIESTSKSGALKQTITEVSIDNIIKQAEGFVSNKVKSGEFVPTIPSTYKDVVVIADRETGKIISIGFDKADWLVNENGIVYAKKHKKKKEAKEKTEEIEHPDINPEWTQERKKNALESLNKGYTKEQLGPSGKAKVHTIKKKGQLKRQKDAAANDVENGAKGPPVKHTKDQKGGNHYHNGKRLKGVKKDSKKAKPYKSKNNKNSNNVHYEY